MKKPVKRIKRYDGGGSVSGGSSGTDSSGSTGSASSGMTGYYNMMSQLRGSLGGSRDSPYASTSGGNAYFRKGGKVTKTAKPKRKR